MGAEGDGSMQEVMVSAVVMASCGKFECVAYICHRSLGMQSHTRILHVSFHDASCLQECSERVLIHREHYMGVEEEIKLGVSQ